MNLVIITGNLCKDIELKKTQSGQSVINNTIGVQRDFKENGEYKTDFIDVVVWGPQADYLANYGTKGDRVEIRGRWQNRTYQTNDGSNRKVSEVIVEKIKLFTKSKKDSDEAPISEYELEDNELPF